MTQQISPFLEGKYGWNYGESGWNTGADENFLKYGYLLNNNVNGVVSSLPALVNGEAYFLTTDSRFYFAVGGNWYSSPCPKWFIFKIKDSGDFWWYDGVSAAAISNPQQLSDAITTIQSSIGSLGTAAYVNIEDLATQAELDIASAQAAAYTDTLRSDLSADAGSSLVGFKQAGVGAVPRTMLDKSREVVSVKDFGAVGDGVTDDAAAFQNAVDALPASGGTICVPDKAYVLSSAPSEGTKSILWLIGPGASFSGAGTGVGLFPYMTTNPAQLAVGPYVRSRSNLTSAHPNGGIAALNAEMIQPSDYLGQSVAIYAGASGSNPSASANVWALNTLIRAEAGAGGTYQCIEVDVDCFSDSALVKGISISGGGTSNPDVGLEILRAAAKWGRGIDVRNAVKAINIYPDDSMSCGISIGDPLDQDGVIISAKHNKNGDDGILIQRNTDLSPSGNFLRCTDAANLNNLFRVDINGGLTASSLSSTGSLKIGSPSNTANLAITAKQVADGQDGIVLQRATDTSPTGNVLRVVNAANSQNLFLLGANGTMTISGNLTCQSKVIGAKVEATGAYEASQTGAFLLSASTTTAVGASGAGVAPPSAPEKYLRVSQDGVEYRIPLYKS